MDGQPKPTFLTERKSCKCYKNLTGNWFEENLSEFFKTCETFQKMNRKIISPYCACKTSASKSQKSPAHSEAFNRDKRSRRSSQGKSHSENQQTSKQPADINKFNVSEKKNKATIDVSLENVSDFKSLSSATQSCQVNFGPHRVEGPQRVSSKTFDRQFLTKWVHWHRTNELQLLFFTFLPDPDAVKQHFSTYSSFQITLSTSHWSTKSTWWRRRRKHWKRSWVFIPSRSRKSLKCKSPAEIRSRKSRKLWSSMSFTLPCGIPQFPREQNQKMEHELKQKQSVIDRLENEVRDLQWVSR